jgi:hypothetical protein
MIPDEVLASIARCDHDDALPILRMLSERVGADTVLRAVALVNTPGGAEDEAPPQFLRAGEFLRAVGMPPPMLVERLIPDHSLVLLSGKPKYGKSLAGLDLADAIAAGRAVWGSYAVNRPGPVAYLAMEDGDHEVANRLLKRGIRLGDQDHELYICTRRLTISQPESVGVLRALLEGIRPVLLVVDTAREALGVVDWSNAAEVGDKLRPLRDFARAVCSVLLITHNRKSAAGDDAVDAISGSNAVTSSVDGFISAYKKEDLANGNRRLHLSVEGRGGMRGDAVIEMDTHTLSFRLVPEDEMKQAKVEAADQARVQRMEPLVAAVLGHRAGKATVNQIAAAVGQEYITVYKQVQAAVEEGVLEDTGERVSPGGRGRPAPLYRVGPRGLSLFSPPSPGGGGELKKSGSAWACEDAEEEEEDDTII